MTQVLRARPDAVDLAIAADVLIYLGDLAELMSAAAAALCAGGRFAFTTEVATGAAEQSDFVLEATGRYAHARSYIERLAANHVLVVEHIAAVIARREGNKPVHARLHVLRRPA